MLRKPFNYRKQPLSDQIAVAWKSAGHLFIAWLNGRIRRWENQPISNRKGQLITVLVGLLLLSSVSVYITTTGLAWRGLVKPKLLAPDFHLTHLTKNYNEQQSNARNAGAQSLRRK